MGRLLRIDISMPHLKPVSPVIVPKKQMTGPATMNGFDEVPATTPTVSYPTQLKAWQLRYNQLPPGAFRILIPPHIGETTHAYLKAAEVLKKASVKCQGPIKLLEPHFHTAWAIIMVPSEVIAVHPTLMAMNLTGDLEVPGCGRAKEAADSHQILSGAARTIPELTKVYGSATLAFPATMSIGDTSAIGQW